MVRLLLFINRCRRVNNRNGRFRSDSSVVLRKRNGRRGQGDWKLSNVLAVSSIILHTTGTLECIYVSLCGYKGFGSSRRLRCCAHNLNTEPDDPCPCLMFARPVSVSVYVFVGKVRPCVHFVRCHFSSFFLGVACARASIWPITNFACLFALSSTLKNRYFFLREVITRLKPKPLSAL